ncbi:20S rRNA accumulation protein 4 [[Candida] anglica]|uniref:20S rRNA accumulation protein 4 n=1 Tax=[Candida] anglica TaxID=148631 RepID=A0ABP0EGZ2_9ASCO
MSSNDYSSDEEDYDNSKTSDVLLGFVDVEINAEAVDEEDGDAPTIEDTIIGGKPVWLHPDSRPTDEQLSCGNCGAKMALLLQAFSPREDALYDRVIYVFGCKSTRTCSKKKGSVKVIRGVSKDPKKIADLEAEEAAKLQRDLDTKLQLEGKRIKELEMTKDLFGSSTKVEETNDNPFGGSNPFSSGNPFGGNNSNPFAAPEKKEDTKPKTDSYAEVAKKNVPAVVKKSDSPKESSGVDDLPSYPGYFLYVQNEKFKVFNDPELEKYKNITEMDVDGGSGNTGRSGGSGNAGGAAQLDPGAAKISDMLDDKFFEAFTNKVRHNPSQVLRYELGGKPLLYSGRDSVAAKFLGKEVTVPAPAYNPSSCRQFELQLMPKAIMDLESEAIGSGNVTELLAGMEWGTIIACTDVEDYVPELDANHVGYVEEWCGVQWEESV